MFSDDTLFYILSTSCVALAVWLFTRRKTPPNYPPGPKGWPFIGVLPYLSNSSQKTYAKWSREKYGPVMSVKLLGHDLVVLNNYDTMKQAFEIDGDKTCGRFKSFLFSKLQGYHGIAFVDGTKYFLCQKEFGVNFLKSYGGSKRFDDVINAELDCFLKSLETKVDNPSNIERQLFGMVGNVVMVIFFGGRYEYEDEVSKQIYDTFKDILGNEDDARLLFLAEMQPLLRFFPPIYFANQRYLTRAKPSMDWMRSFIRNARKNLGKDNSNSFINHYLKKHLSSSDDQLLAYVRDCVGGIRNAYSALRWIILCSMLYPDECRQVVEEIDQVLGKTNVPTSKTEPRLIKTRAFVEEVMRICSPLPKSLERKTHDEIRLGKYVIPKGTELAGNFWGANHDPKDWPDPDKFDPLRHIDENGNLVFPSKVIQFSLGPRNCFGQYFARPLLLMTFTRLLQRFEISAIDGEELPSVEDPYQGITYDAKHYDVMLKSRI